MEITLEEFQKAVGERKVEPGRKPRPYSEEQRRFAVDYARRELAAGKKKSQILRTLGISDGALSKWMGKEEEAAGRGFRRVQLKTVSGAEGVLTLVAPGGYRIEGLSLESAAALLATLG